MLFRDAYTYIVACVVLDCDPVKKKLAKERAY